MATHRLAVIALAAVAVIGCREKSRFQPPRYNLPIPWSAACLALEPLAVGWNVEPPQLIQRVEPKLPTGVQVAPGVVLIGTIIDSQGNICDAHVIKGLTFVADRACVEAIREWRFRPAMLDGKPRAVFFTLTISVGTPRGAEREGDSQGDDLPSLPTAVPWSRECLALKPLGLRVSGGEPPRVIQRVEPVFPPGTHPVSGYVIVGTIIDNQGNVCDVHVMKGLTPAIDGACLEAVLHWRFQPATLHGTPRAGIFYLTVKVGRGATAGRPAGE